MFLQTVVQKSSVIAEVCPVKERMSARNLLTLICLLQDPVLLELMLSKFILIHAALVACATCALCRSLTVARTSTALTCPPESSPTR